jgi:hypothetical protein
VVGEEEGGFEQKFAKDAKGGEREEGSFEQKPCQRTGPSSGGEAKEAKGEKMRIADC